MSVCWFCHVAAHIVYGNSNGSGENTQMPRLARASAVRLRDSNLSTLAGSFCHKNDIEYSVWNLLWASFRFSPTASNTRSDKSGVLVPYVPICQLLSCLLQSLYGPRQANLCLRAFRHDKFQLRMPSHSERPGIWVSV